MRKKTMVCVFVILMSMCLTVGCGGSKKDNNTSAEKEVSSKTEDTSVKDSKEEEALTKDLSEYSDIEWPDSTVTKLIPKPKSMVGKISFETDDTIMVDIANTSDEAYEAYIKECQKKGFTEDYAKSTTLYTAANENGYSVVIMLEDDHVMSVTACETDATVGDVTNSNATE